jgi:N-acetylneuraminic acid mutarotase
VRIQFTLKRPLFGMLVGLMLSGLLLLPSIGFAQANTWTPKADMPTEKGWLSTAVADGKIYVIGGWHFFRGGSFQGVEAYDPATDTWTEKADLSAPKHGVCACTVNGKIYAIGGVETVYVSNPVSTVEVYDPITDTWTPKANMPTARGEFACVAVNGKIYAIGGVSRPQQRGNIINLRADELVSAVEVYDPATDTWTKKADMPNPRVGLRGVSVNGKIYVMGGVVNGNTAENVLNLLEEYDPVTDTWTQKTDMPTARWNLAAVTVNGKIYAIGGSDLPAWDRELATMEIYDPVSDTWTKGVDIPTPRLALAASAVDGRIYVIGGWAASPSFDKYLATVEEFDTGFRDTPVVSVNPQGKLATTWATIKRGR